MGFVVPEQGLGGKSSHACKACNNYIPRVSSYVYQTDSAAHSPHVFGRIDKESVHEKQKHFLKCHVSVFRHSSKPPPGTHSG